MMRKLVLLASLAAVAAPAFAADNFAAKDGNGVIITKRAKDTGGGILADANILLDTSFNLIDPATKQQLPASLGPKLGATSLSFVPATDATFPLGSTDATNLSNLLAVNGAKTDPGNCAVDATAVSELAALKCTVSKLAAVVQALTGTLAVAQGDIAQSNTINAATVGATYTILPANGASTAYFFPSGLAASGAVLAIDASLDGTTWPAPSIGGIVAGTGLSITAPVADVAFRVNAGGRKGIRLRVVTPGTGTITVTSVLSVAPFDSPTPARDGNGDLRVPTVTNTPYFVSLGANASTEVLPALATRIAFDIQCAATGNVGVSRTHATLTSATPSAGGADFVIPSGTTAPFAPAYASAAGVTAYTATAQACWGVSYARQ